MTAIPEPYAATLRQLHQPVTFDEAWKAGGRLTPGDDDRITLCLECRTPDGTYAHWPTSTDRAIYHYRKKTDMGYAVYEDTENNRWAGYGVPAVCDAVGCTEEVNRGLGCKCETHWEYDDDDNDIENKGCGLFFCGEHENHDTEAHANATPKPDSAEWLQHMLTDESWQEWRDINPDAVTWAIEQLPREEL